VVAFVGWSSIRFPYHRLSINDDALVRSPNPTSAL
jgi:hypothetical protein